MLYKSMFTYLLTYLQPSIKLRLPSSYSLNQALCSHDHTHKNNTYCKHRKFSPIIIKLFSATIRMVHITATMVILIKQNKQAYEWICQPHYKLFLNSSTNNNGLPISEHHGISPATITSTAGILTLQFSTTRD